MPSPRIIRATVRGVPGWLFPATGRFLPLIAGAQEGDGGGDGDGGDGGAPAAIIVKPGTGDEKPGTPAAGDPAAGEAALRDAGKAALDAERTARKAAEKQAREAAARLKALEDQSLSETDKLKQEAETGKKLAETATTKLRKANLTTALAEEGFSGAKVKAVARLLDGVEYDDDDEPTNLKQALKAAEREYGDLVKPQPVATSFDGGARGDAAGGAPTMDQLIRRAAGRS